MPSSYNLKCHPSQIFRYLFLNSQDSKKNVMKNKKVHNSYQRNYYESALQKTTMVVKDTPYIHNHIEKMIQHSDINKSHTILEVGAGLGKFTVPMLKEGFTISANDLSPVLLEKLQECTTQNINTIPCDIIDIHKNIDTVYDKIIGFFTLHHMMDLRAVFSSLSKIIKPKGEITFIEPIAFNPLYYLQIAMTPKMSMKAERGILNMTDRFVHNAMQSSDFKPLKSVTYGIFPPFIYNNRIARRGDHFISQQQWLKWAHAFIVFRGQKQ